MTDPRATLPPALVKHITQVAAEARAEAYVLWLERQHRRREVRK